MCLPDSFDQDSFESVEQDDITDVSELEFRSWDAFSMPKSATEHLTTVNRTVTYAMESLSRIRLDVATRV